MPACCLLRAFDQRYGLTRGSGRRVCDGSRRFARESPGVCRLLRQRLYQIIAGYEDARTTLTDYVTIQRSRFLPISRSVNLSDHNPLSAAGRTRPHLAICSSLQDALLDWFVKNVRKTSPETRKRSCWMSILPTIPTHGQQQLSFFNGGYDQHMYHPLLIFERHTGCLLAARLHPGKVVSHARILPLLLRIVPRLQREFPNVPIKLRADAGFATAPAL